MKPSRLLKTKKSSLLEIYKQLFPYVQQFYPEMGVLGISNCISSLGIAQDLFGLDQAVDGFSDLMNSLMERLVEERSNAKLQYLVLGLNYAVDHQFENKERINTLLEEVLKHPIEDFRRWSTSYMLKVFAKVDPVNYEQMHRFIVHFIKKFGLTQINNEISFVYLMMAAAKSRYHIDQVDTMISRLLTRSQSLSPSLLLLMAEIVANQTLKFEFKETLASKIGNFVTRVDGATCEVSQLVDLVYYISSVNCKQYELQSLVDECLQRIQNVDVLSDEQKIRLWWAKLFSQTYGQEIVWLDTLMEICKNAQVLYNRDKVLKVREDEFVQEVFESIKKFYPEAQCGVLIQDDELLISILVEEGGKKVAIEPRSYDKLLKGEPYLLLGTLQSELSVCEKLGYCIVVVTEHQWRENGKEDTLQRIKGCLEGNYTNLRNAQDQMVLSFKLNQQQENIQGTETEAKSINDD
eukprot:TRINITY_DN3395_c1_g1_i7.p1 TRINITY_DN3395_c1_g1~~TRINITY_DN3395_c1_g1_i7.p1  ORF type:complete len:464 (-),score=53.86 TRINITY_DN3395_c1_g1_i7:266-1657(-)